MPVNKFVLASTIPLAAFLAGCGSGTTGSIGPGPGPGPGFTATAGGLAASANVTPSGIEVASGEKSTAEIDYNENSDQITMAFSGGNLDGRTIGFQPWTEEGDQPLQADAVSGLAAGEDAGALTALYAEDKASFAGVVTLESGDFLNPQPGDKVDIYALYGANPAHGEHSLPGANDTLEYAGTMVGVGADSPTNAGNARGDVNITADFGTGDVEGTISNIAVEGAAFGGGDVGFSATMSTDKASYEGTDITMGGAAATGNVEGGFYGIEAAETAGAIMAVSDDNALVGAFQADKQ
ncbi:hypothetical protein L598_000700000060 [Mesorhizobium sp. J18]|uniref:transferrin-binding protein-like solute binding protein n=1 Tax=Mesorhizobium sp. J18 TaxID=935263 RepID=UPI00119B21A8|nr:transferrin-binding protein-like solute binding protein [Mesorhizobium sp. J18]TWG90250.1 hypothetical protein L598_000700000060 [Mesorhizobium sp. J18]